MNKTLRKRKGWYRGCYTDIDSKEWTLGETLTLKALLDEWWNSVRITDPKTGKEMCCYKNAYTCDPAYEDAYSYGALPKSMLNKMVKVRDEWDEDEDGYPIVRASFI